MSELAHELAEIENSLIYTNYGPVNTKFEETIVRDLFGGKGSCVTVCNATIGLMLALKEARERSGRAGRYALMPSFTFAATAHAALWAGLTPLLCDIDENDWTPSRRSEDELLEKHGSDIGVVVPYATFGVDIDLSRYDDLYRREGIPTVVDAAASLGTSVQGGRNFGAGFHQAVVYSMHATKTFATGEAGLIFSENDALIRRLRSMGNFGFEAPRTASLPGLNSKLSEVGALLALKKLDDFSETIAKRSEIAQFYKRELRGAVFQEHRCDTLAYQFLPARLTGCGPGARERVVASVVERGVGVAKYFSPHLAQQPYFQTTSVVGNIETTDVVSSEMLSLPLYESMTVDDLDYVVDVVNAAITGAA